jgi:hypothetical protein
MIWLKQNYYIRLDLSYVWTALREYSEGDLSQLHLDGVHEAKLNVDLATPKLPLSD